jgi:hypothetical protein
MTEADLDRLDPEGYVVISQHGYSHLADRYIATTKGEFGDADVPTDASLIRIRRGFDTVVSRFPKRFDGGFSAPYDRSPSWFGAAWIEVGGSFISSIRRRWGRTYAPEVYFSVDIWDWDSATPVHPNDVAAQLHESTALFGYCGITIHSWLLNGFDNAARIEQIVGDAISHGAFSVTQRSLSSIQNAE